MQDRYAGDVGDFSKFALLRMLQKYLHSQLGLVWYLFHGESNGDGQHVDYVDQARWTKSDADLACRLKEVVSGESRSVKTLETSGILREDTLYFGEELNPRGKRGWIRKAWFERAASHVADCPIVMVDPDNGIAGPNHQIGLAKGGKHITLEEIKHLSRNHDCVVIYHHFDRNMSHRDQGAYQIERLEQEMPEAQVFGLRYKRISPRAYFFVAKPRVVDSLELVFDELTTHPWDWHFELLKT